MHRGDVGLADSRGEAGEGAVDGDAVLLEEQDRAPQAALAPARRERDVGIVGVDAAIVADRRGDRLRGERREIEPAAARADGREQPARARGRRRRRASASAAPPGSSGARWRRSGSCRRRGRRWRSASPPRRWSSRRSATVRRISSTGELGLVALGLVVPGPLQDEQVGMGARRRRCGRRDVLGNGEVGGARDRRRTPDRDGRRRSGRSGRRASPCRCPSGRRAARRDASGRRDRRRAASSRPSASPRPVALAPPAAASRRARRGARISSIAPSAPPRASRRADTACQISSATSLLAADRIDDDAALRLAAGDGEIGLPPRSCSADAHRSRSGRGRRRSRPGGRGRGEARSRPGCRG